MSDSTIVLITGASRSLGRALVQTYLSRPNHIVVGSVRDKASPNAQELSTLPTAAGSRLFLVKIENTSLTDPTDAVKDLQAAGIDSLDIVIANAGCMGTEIVAAIDTVKIEDVTTCFNVNTLGSLVLFQAVRPLLQKSKLARWVAITSAAGSIGSMEAFGTSFVSSYGISKAGLNWVTMAAHCSNKWLTAVALHPGFVQTEGGNVSAKALGMEKPPNTIAESIKGITVFIDQATREKSSGKFYDAINNTEIPW
ncbi:NAD(P)-binding protein [Lipomyces starkeyi]